MNFRILASAAVALLLGACTDQAAGQKGHTTALATTMDSVSYGIGTDIGHNMKVGGLDSLNVDALAMGIRDGLDSAEKITGEQVRALVQAYMIEAQKKSMAKQQAKSEENLRKGEAWLSENGKKPGVVTTASGVQYQVVNEGTGPKPKGDDVVQVHYRGMLIDGTEFDSSYPKGQPLAMPLSQWIPGFSEVLQLMSVGSKYKAFIPSNLAYGAQGMGQAIPPYSVLVFDMELVGINPAGGR